MNGELKEEVLALYEEVVHALGSGEELLDECETTTCYAISVLSKKYPQIKKVSGLFDEKGHFWCEIEGEIIDLSVEQFEGRAFTFPLTKEMEKLYEPVEVKGLSQELLADCQHIAAISGFSL